MLVGRAAECGRIEAMLADVRTGVGGALLIRGEPGIGKTALVEYAVRRSEDLRILSVLGVDSEAVVPHSGLHVLLAPVLPVLDSLAPRQAHAIRVALGEETADELDAIAVYSGVFALFAELAAEQPLLIVADDAHWLDDESALALGFVARRVAGEALGVLLAARSTESFEAPGVPVLEVDGVDDAAGVSLVGRSVPEVDPVVARSLVRQTGGNPLALLELPLALDLDQRSGRRPLDDPLAVTASVERAFLTRAARLSPVARRALLLASAADTADYATIVGAEPDAAAGLDEGERSGLISIRRGRVEFRHPLVRSALYSSAPQSEVRAVHTALADRLAAGAPLRSAWHRALASTEPDEAVAATLTVSARGALRSGAAATAARLLEQAAVMTPPGERRDRRLLDAGQAAWLGGRPKQALALLERARDRAVDPLLVADIAVAEWWAVSSSGDPEPLFEPLVARAEQIADLDPRRAARMLGLAWDFAWDTMAIDRARVLAHRGRDLLGDDVTADDREVLTALAWTQLGDCQVAQGVATARQAIELSEGCVDLQAAFACEVLIAADLIDEAAAAAERTLELLRRLGHAPALAYTYQALAEAELRRGNLAASLSLSTQALTIGDEGGRWLPGWQLAQLATVEAHLGLEAPCREHIAAARRSGWAGASWSGARADAALGMLELGLGNDPAALAALDRAHDVAAVVRHPGYIQYAADRVETLVRLGHQQRAREALDDLEERATSSGSQWAAHAALRCRLLLAPVADLAALLDEAAALPASPFEAARTMLAGGERLRRAGNRLDARVRLNAALETFENTGARPWAERARIELRASGARLRKTQPSARDELTPQELQVALVVAEGVTNREAAARLFLSPKTIEVHLSRAFRKLGVRTRTELARQLSFAQPPASAPPHSSNDGPAGG